ncbi:MAG: aspartate 1-decarboxylase [Phototrophicales bacterium]|nr:aspartate 1-decarboxylase [Phototrophicales bacterium]
MTTIEMLQAKIHQPRVTHADLNYEGSIGIDVDIIAAAKMFINQKVLVVDIENGNRFETYIIPAPSGSKQFQVNGAAARLVSPGDRLIIMGFIHMPYPPSSEWTPRILLMNEDNTIKETIG